jgi:pimeloyl-ACP methyl ester carboxylesterase
MPTLNVSEGVDLYYEEYGSGETVVLSAHMAIAPGESYQKLLGQAGFHVFSLQLRGFGESTHVFEPPVGGWYPMWAEDVYQFGRAVGAHHFIYTGVSHGAGVGWNLVLTHPEAVHAFVAVVGGPHDRNQPRTRGIGVDGPNPPPMFEVPTSDPVRLQRRADRARYMRERAERMSSAEERAINPGKLFPEIETNEQLSAHLSHVKVATLLLYAAQDDIVPSEMALLALKAVSGAKLVLYQDHSHSLASEAPERLVDEVLLFMKEIGGVPLPA